MTEYGFTQNDNRLIFFDFSNCTVHNSYLPHDDKLFFRLQESLFGVNKAQESGSGKVSSDSPGNQG